jgi:hypothetical protein
MIFDATGDPIAESDPHPGTRDYIVTACNALPAALASLREIVAGWDAYLRDSTAVTPLAHINHGHIARAKKAIKDAEGGQS